VDHTQSVDNNELETRELAKCPICDSTTGVTGSKADRVTWEEKARGFT